MDTDYEALRPYCNTARQKEVLEAVISEGAMRAASRKIGLDRRRIQEHIAAIKKNAAERLYAPEHGLVLGTPDGLTGRAATIQATGTEVERVWYKVEKDNSEQMFTALMEGLSKNIRPARPTKPNRKIYSEDLCSAVILGDPHIGMLAHAVETGGEDYDMHKCINDIKRAIDYSVDMAPASVEGWLINVGDLTHANDDSNTTANSHNHMDVSARNFATMEAAGAILRYGVSKMLTKFQTVKVVNARGNHDNDAARAVNWFMSGVYEKEPRVEVLSNHSKFAFLEFGQNLIMVNHGDRINDNRLAGTMTRLAAEAWGRTKYKRIWVGHIHHKTRREHDSGCTIESFPVLSPTDAWHAACGYGSERGCTVITLHRKYGHVAQFEPSIEMLRSIAA